MRFIAMSALISASLFSARAADRVIVDPAQMLGQYNSDPGKLIFAGNQLIFVDDANPSNSFALSRADITSYNMANGVVTLMMAQPLNMPMGSSPTVSFRVMNANTPSDISAWAGMPAAGAPQYPVNSADRYAGPDNVGPAPGGPPPDQAVAGDYQYNAHYNGEDGRLIVGPGSLQFVSVRHPDRSRTWDYREIREFKREGDNVKLEPYRGDSARIYIDGGRPMSDQVYNMIGDRIVDARRH